MNLYYYIYMIFYKVKTDFIKVISKFYVLFLFKAFNVKHEKFIVNGLPVIRVGKNGRISIGNNFKMNNGKHFNQIGRQQPCFFIVNGKLVLKNNVGISNSAIICQNKITIGNNVKIGGNTVIYDTDFHSVDFKERRNFEIDLEEAHSEEIIIGDDVFIGAHTTILKGVQVGNRSVIGACSLVTTHIPPDEIWGGVPARFIKKISQ